MKKIGAIIFLLCSLSAHSQDKQTHEFLLTIDSIQSLPNYVSQHWKFIEGDDSLMALPTYNDSGWKEVRSTSMRILDTTTKPFNGMGWFRLHFITDSTVAGKPLAMTMMHYGASEIYMDGKLLKSFGKINGADSSIYYRTAEVPFIFIAPAVGEHVLAVRYVNYDAQKNYKKYRESLAGFELSITEADREISWRHFRSIVFTFTLMLLSGVFISLCLVHLFLFVYHRADRSNLYFSIFMFCFGLVFIIGFISFTSTHPSFQMQSVSLLIPLFIIAVVALAGFIQTLFQKKMWRFRFLVLLGAVALIMRIFRIPGELQVFFALIISVSFDSAFTIIFAIIKRVKGARIIGTGLLFSLLFVLTIFGIAFAYRGENIDFNDSTVAGQIFIALSGLAILSIPFSMSLYQAWRYARINSDLGWQLEQVHTLSEKTLQQEQEKQLLLKNKKEELENEVMQRTAELQAEKKKSDDLLLNILPVEIANEIKLQGRSSAKTFSMVTVMFTDFKDFTEVSEKVSAELLVAEIDYCFSAFDNIIHKYKIEKIKTVGDAYLCAGGLPVLTFTHAADIVNAAIEIRNFMAEHKKKKEAKGEIPFEIRIGIHTGPVVAGIVGVKKFAYDIWGDTVNLAARMEEQSEAGKINISGATYQLLKDKFTCVYRGKIQAKNKGEIDMYFVE